MRQVIDDQYSRKQVGSIHVSDQGSPQAPSPKKRAAPARAADEAAPSVQPAVKRAKAPAPSVIPVDPADNEEEEDIPDDGGKDDEDYRPGGGSYKTGPANKGPGNTGPSAPLVFPPSFPAPPGEIVKALPEMSFCLRWDEEHDIPETKFYTLEKPYLRTSSAITIMHLKKYLIQKYELKNDTVPLQFRCRGNGAGQLHRVVLALTC